MRSPFERLTRVITKAIRRVATSLGFSTGPSFEPKEYAHRIGGNMTGRPDFVTIFQIPAHAGQEIGWGIE
jgi:hypothetical protein